MHKYTEKEREFFRSYVPGHSHKEILEAFNRRFEAPISLTQVKGYIKNNKLNTGRTGRYEKGHVPANKGTHIGGWEPTQFKKGCIPVNHKPVGTESVRRNYKRGSKYVWIKVAEPNHWRMKHVVVWEQQYGKVPRNKIVIFLDGDPLNTDITNLAIIDRSTHVRMNQSNLRTGDPELTMTGIKTAELITKIAAVKRGK